MNTANAHYEALDQSINSCRAAMSTELLASINERWDPTSPRCGRLIQRLNRVWHYSVALSDSWAIEWGPEGGPGLAGEGRLTVHSITPEFFDTKKVAYLPLPDIYANLIASVTAFHGAWRYGMHGWNCEHWARLVVSGEAVSYQVAQTGWGIFDILRVLRRHRGAEQHLATHRALAAVAHVQP
jgi:hypothetical protein